MGFETNPTFFHLSNKFFCKGCRKAKFQQEVFCWNETLYSDLVPAAPIVRLPVIFLQPFPHHPDPIDFLVLFQQHRKQEYLQGQPMIRLNAWHHVFGDVYP